MKFVFPCSGIGLFGMGTCGLWLGAFHDRNSLPPPEPVKWIFLAVWLVGSGFIFWFSGRIKRVQVDDAALYVSNYWSEVRRTVHRGRPHYPESLDQSAHGHNSSLRLVSLLRTNRLHSHVSVVSVWHPSCRQRVAGFVRPSKRARRRPKRQVVKSRDQWPFADPKDVAVITLKSIAMGGSPVLHVTHDADDGMWQYLDGMESIRRKRFCPQPGRDYTD